MTYFDGLDTNQYERTVGTGSNDPLPVGFYELVITRNTLKKASERAKDTNGKYIEVEFDVQIPAEFNRRKYWDKFNIINKSQEAVRIGKEQFSDLLKQVGITSLPAGELDESCPVPELLGRSVCAYLAIDKGQNGYNDSNKCLKYLPSGSTLADYEAWYASKKGAAKTVVPEKKAWGAQPSAPAAQPEAKKAAPWKKTS